jgi:GR25 family glycosyltransferase involved in LPS biosynthesis
MHCFTQLLVFLSFIFGVQSTTSAASTANFQNVENVENWWIQTLNIFPIQQILVINLERRTDRRTVVEHDLNTIRALAHIPYEFLNATDRTDPQVIRGLTNIKIPANDDPITQNDVHIPSVVATIFSWRRALFRAIELNQFPILITEDDIALSAPALEIIFPTKTEQKLFWPDDTVMISFASSGFHVENFDSSTKQQTVPGYEWLTYPKSGNWGIAALFFPSLSGCKRMLKFVQEFNTVIYHMDIIMLEGFNAANRGNNGGVYIAQPSLLHWHASYSDILDGYRVSSRSVGNSKKRSCSSLKKNTGTESNGNG